MNGLFSIWFSPQPDATTDVGVVLRAGRHRLTKGRAGRLARVMEIILHELYGDDAPKDV